MKGNKDFKNFIATNFPTLGLTRVGPHLEKMLKICWDHQDSRHEKASLKFVELNKGLIDSLSTSVEVSKAAIDKASFYKREMEGHKANNGKLLRMLNKAVDLIEVDNSRVAIESIELLREIQEELKGF